MILGKKLTQKNATWAFLPEEDQVYYDYKHKLMIFKRENQLEFLPFANERFLLPHVIRLPPPDFLKEKGKCESHDNVNSLAFSYRYKVLVMHRRNDKLEICDPLDISRSTSFKLPSGSRVILYDWIRRNRTGNFFIVTTGGAHIIKIDETNISTKKLHNTNNNIINAWFDHKKQKLALNFMKEENRIKIYDLNKLDDGINFKYPNYIVDLKCVENGKKTPIPVFVSNYYLDQSRMQEKKVHTQVIDLINLYGDSYLMHANCVSGRLYLYKLGTKNPLLIKILSESQINYNVIDNLLILHYVNEKISTIIDVRKEGGMNQIFGAPRTAVPYSDPEENSPETENILGNVEIEIKDDVKVKKPDPFEWIFKDFYNQNNINLDFNLIVNVKKKLFMTIQLNLEETVMSSESPVEIFCFLFRRYNTKSLYISHLKELFLRQQKIFDIAIVMNKILVNYKIAIQEIQMMNITGSKINLDTYSKLKSGESFMKLKEIETKLIDPLRKIFMGNKKLELYFLDVMLTLLSLAVEKKIDLGKEIELFIIRLFLRTKKYQTFHQFVQNGVLHDRYLTALILCELGTKSKRPAQQDMENCHYRPAFQLGIDMLFRLGKDPEFKKNSEELIFSYFLRNFRVFECIHMLEKKKFQISYNNLEDLIRTSNHPESNYTFKQILEYFSLDQTKTKVLGSYEKFDEILNNIMKENEFIDALTG